MRDITSKNASPEWDAFYWKYCICRMDKVPFYDLLEQITCHFFSKVFFSGNCPVKSRL